MVFGNERNYVVALITLDPDALPGWAAENGVSGDYAAIVKSDACQAMVQGYVDELNKNLNRWETIKKWELLDHDLTVESGELTPSMKVKRNVVEDNYKDVIDGFYALTCAVVSRPSGAGGSRTVGAPISSSTCRTPGDGLDLLTGTAQETHRVPGSTGT